MADIGIYTKSADIAARAGVNVSATAITATETDKYVLAVEAYLNARTMFNWSDFFLLAGNADVLAFATEASASLCAMKAIMQDMSGFTSRVEAQTMLDVLRDAAANAIKSMEDKNVQKWVSDQ